MAWHLALEHSLCHTPGHQETVWPWHAWLQPRHHRYTTAMASEMLLVDLKRDYRIGHLDNACPISYSNWASNPLHLYIKYNTTQPDEHPNKYHTPYHNHKVIRDNGLNNQLIQLNSFATIKSVDEREQTQWAENAAVAPPSPKCGFSLYYPALTQWPEYKDSNITQYSDLIEYSSIKFWDKVTKHKNIWQFCIIGNAKVIQLSM